MMYLFGDQLLFQLKLPDDNARLSQVMSQPPGKPVTE